MSRYQGTRRIRPRAPWPLVVLGALGAAVFLLPIIGLVTRTPWSRLGELVTSDEVVAALKLSLFTSVMATLVALIIGVPLAWLLARTRFPGQRLLRGVVTLPMVLPPVVGGAALLFALGRTGFIGAPIYDATATDGRGGFLLPYSVWGVVLANVFVAMPFLVVTVEGALNNLDSRYESAAATLGASRLTVFRRVTLPMIAPSLRAGLVLTWARSLGEFGATVTFAGNLEGNTRTLPLAVFLALGSDRDTAIAISLVLIVVSLLVLVILRDRWWSRGALA